MFPRFLASLPRKLPKPRHATWCHVDRCHSFRKRRRRRTVFTTNERTDLHYTLLPRTRSQPTNVQIFVTNILRCTNFFHNQHRANTHPHTITTLQYLFCADTFRGNGEWIKISILHRSPHPFPISNFMTPNDTTWHPHAHILHTQHFDFYDAHTILFFTDTFLHCFLRFGLLRMPGWQHLLRTNPIFSHHTRSLVTAIFNIPFYNY